MTMISSQSLTVWIRCATIIIVLFWNSSLTIYWNTSSVLMSIFAVASSRRTIFDLRSIDLTRQMIYFSPKLRFAPLCSTSISNPLSRYCWFLNPSLSKTFFTFAFSSSLVTKFPIRSMFLSKEALNRRIS